MTTKELVKKLRKDLRPWTIHREYITDESFSIDSAITVEKDGRGWVVADCEYWDEKKQDQVTKTFPKVTKYDDLVKLLKRLLNGHDVHSHGMAPTFKDVT